MFRNSNFDTLVPYQPLKVALFNTCSKNLEKGFEKYLHWSLALSELAHRKPGSSLRLTSVTCVFQNLVTV